MINSLSNFFNIFYRKNINKVNNYYNLTLIKLVKNT